MKNVLVTGATRGLGLEIARVLVEQGHRVIGSGRRNSDALAALAAEAHEGGALHFMPLDLARLDSLQEAVQQVVKTHGPLYGLVNNAALAHDGVLSTMHNSEIEELVAVNLTGTMVLTKYVLRGMLVQQAGRVVNISSIIAATGFNGLSAYGATKAALNGFTRSLAREVGKLGITVNAVAPGYMETDMSRGLKSEQLDSIRRRSAMRRLVSVRDVAQSVAFLLSDEAEHITGTVLTVDAGSTA